MRVLCLLPTPPPYSGPEILAARLLAELPSVGIDVVHVRANIHGANARKGHITAGTLLMLLRTVFATLRAAIVRRPTLAYVNLSQNFTGFARDAVLILTCRVLRIPVAAHLHGGDFATFYANAGRVMRMFIRFVLRRLTSLILLAERFRPQFERLVAPERQFVLYNAIERELFAGAETRFDDPSRDGATVLYVGHLSHAKGFADALRVVPLVLARFPNVRFRFAGEWITEERNLYVGRDATTSITDEWRALSERFPDRVQLLGVIAGDEKERAFREADIFFFPSYAEGFPIVVLEAMAASLPIVGTRVGALAEVLVDRVHGQFAEAGDVDAFAEAIATLAQSPEARRAIGLHNRQDVLSRFASEDNVRRLVAIFRATAGVPS